MNSYIVKTNPICPECGREVAIFYDVEYALISHPLSSAFEDKVCIYCAMRIQKDVMDRKLQEYGTYLDENLPDIYRKLIGCAGAYQLIIWEGLLSLHVSKSLKTLRNY